MKFPKDKIVHDAHNVLFVSYDGMTDPLGQSQVIPYLKGLSQKGYSISILSCEKPDNYFKNRERIFSILKDANIGWFTIKYHKFPPILSTLFDTYLLWRKALKISVQKKIRIVHCRSYISSIIGLALFKKKGIPFIFDMRGFYPEERVDGNLWNLRNPIFKWVFKYFKGKEREFVKYSSSTISLTEAGKKVMNDWEVVKRNNIDIKVIPCSADFDFFKILPEDRILTLKQKLGFQEEDMILSYLGSIGTWYLLNEMLDFYKLLQKRYPQFKFLILTPEKPEKILECSRKKGIKDENLKILFANRSELVDKIAISDLSIFFIKPSFSKISSSPTKLGELLAMGIPVICNAGIGDVDEIILKTNGGIVVEGFTPEKYLEAINKIDSLLKSDPEVIRKQAFNYYGLNKAIDSYNQVYQDALNRSVYES